MRLKNISLLNLFRWDVIQTILEYLFVFTLVLNMRSVFVHTPKTGFVKTLVILMMGCCVVGCFVCKMLINYKNFCLGIVYSVGLFAYIGIFYLMHHERNGMLLKIMVEVAVIALYVFMIENHTRDTMKKFTDIMVVIAGISLIFWVAGSQMHLISPSGKWKLDWGNALGMGKGFMNVYYGIYFETQTIDFGRLEIIRNSAIFAEAPMCGAMVAIAFLSELFLTENPQKLRAIILMCTALTTFSTTCIVICMLGAGVWYVLKKGIKLSGSMWTLFLRFVLAPCLIITVAIVGYSMVASKMDTHSGAARTLDFVNGFRAWADAPILGYGIGSQPLLGKYGNYGFSNSIIPILTQGGLYIFIIYLIPMVRVIFRNIVKRNWKYLAFYVLFSSLFIITIIPFQNLTFYLFLTMVKQEKPIKKTFTLQEFYERSIKT